MIMVVQDCPGCWFDSDFRRGERYSVLAMGRLTGIGVWLQGRGRIGT
jgi:hypothetical protein